MSSMKINIIVLVSIALLSSAASATKCLKAQTMEELKKDFPIVVRGKIVERKKSLKDENSFSLKIHVERIIQGKLKETDLKANEIHYGKNFWRVYEVGKEYTFLVTPKGKKGAYEVTLPLDGCPELPLE